MKTKLILTLALISVFYLAKAQKADTLNASKEDKIYTAVEREPQFPGGMSNFYTLLAKSIHNLGPNEREARTKILIRFVVEKDGSLSNIKVSSASMGTNMVEEDVNSPFYKDIATILRLSPNWRPGILNGRPVRCQYAAPVRINLATNDN